MIKRITNEEEFCQVIDELDAAFSKEEQEQYHYFLKHDKEAVKERFANKQLLAWDIFVWANKTNGKCDAMIIFINDKNIKFNTPIFTEFLWVSKNPKASFKLLKTAVKFGRDNGFEFIQVGLSVKHYTSEKLRRVYEKLGFIKDSETYIAKL